MRRLVITALATLCLAACNNPSSATADQTTTVEDAATESEAETTTSTTLTSEVASETPGVVQTELVTTQDGDTTVTQAADGGAMPLPEGFPDDVYLPDDYEVTTTTDNADTRTTYFKTSGDLEALFDAASRGMQEKGWTVTGTMKQSPTAHSLMFAKGQRTGGINVIKTDETGLVLMVYFDKPCGSSMSRMGATGPAPACPEGN